MSLDASNQTVRVGDRRKGPKEQIRDIREEAKGESEQKRNPANRSVNFDVLGRSIVVKWVPKVVKNLFNLLSPPDDDEDLQAARKLCHERRQSIQEDHQVITVNVAEAKLENAVNQNLERIEKREREVKSWNVVAARPEADKLPSELLDTEKIFFFTEAFNAEIESHNLKLPSSSLSSLLDGLNKS